MATTSPTIHDIVESYAHVYQLSSASYFYVYIMWATFAGISLLFALFRHWTGGRVGYLGSVWNKWLLRRRTWRKKHSLMVAAKAGKKHSQPFSLPSNAHLLSVTLLWVFAIALCFVGPDYIATNEAATFTKPFITKRAFASSTLSGNVFHSTIQKSWWTSSARLGVISLTLFPLCVLFVTKAPPFALLAVPYFVQIWNDKLVFIHKWTGRLIYLITSLHVAFWSVQLAQDKVSPTDRCEVWSVIFSHVPFIYAWIAFICFTILIVLSFKPIRHKHFEFFYFSHVLLVPLILIFTAFHFPRLQWWSWMTLIIWGSERIYRFAKLIRVNSIITNLRTAPMTLRYIDFIRREEAGTIDKECNSSMSSSEDLDEQTTEHRRPGYSYCGTYIPPPGYAHVLLLPGKIARVRLVTPHYFTWAPGQHVLLTIPAISHWQSHPFTISSACNTGSAETDAQDIILLIRAQSGFTKALYKHVEKLAAQQSRGDTPCYAFIPPNEGVLLRAYVGGPFGSSVGVRWTTYSTVMIVAGGSGCSYAASVLEHVTKCVAGKHDMTFSGCDATQIKRIRFIWLVREFAYMQWIASQVRRAMERVPEGILQVDIYVTNTMSERAGERLAIPVNVRSYTEISLDSPGAYDGGDEEVYGEVDDIDSDGELGHEEHVLDMTNFGGEDDTMRPAEREFSRQLQAEGEMRRLLKSTFHSMARVTDRGSIRGSARPSLPHPLPTNHHQPTEETSLLESPIAERPFSMISTTTTAIVPEYISDMREADDMFFLSEVAHSGRAKMDEIIAEEAALCPGSSMLVCCCGPTALSATIRKHVARNTKPCLVLKGKAPSITLASEEFES